MLSPRYFSYLVLLCLLCIAPGRLLAQDFNHYKPLRSEGNMPAKFTTSSSEKYKKDVAKKVSDKDKKRDRQAKERFLLESNFQIDNLLLSGKVLFNDPVSLYVNRVLDELLKDEPKLRSEIEAYAVKSPAVNAFATDNGIILVNVGLIAHLDNEAQLAYVLAHEITHYRKQHSLDEYVEQTRIESGRGVYKGTSVDERLLARSNYSKEKESEADMEGLKLFLKSNYSLDALDDVFDVLAYSEFPYADVEIKKSFFERGHLVLPNDYWRVDTDSIKPEDDSDDSLSSHPAVEKRREAVQEEIEGKSNKGRQEFLVSEEEFMRVRKICRFESSEQFMQKRQFEAALYNSYLLLQEDSTNQYLQTNAFDALYSLAKYNNAGSVSDVHTAPEDVTGNSQRLYHLIHKISPAELSLLTLVHGWNLYKKYPDDQHLAAEVHDIFKEMVTQHYPERDFFSTTAAPIDTATVEETTGADGSAEKTDSKPKKKKKKKKKQSDMAKYALVDLLQDSSFVAEYDAYANALKKKSTKKKGKKDEREEDEDSEPIIVFDGESSSIFDKDVTSKNTVTKMLIVNPYYYYVRLNKKHAVQYTESEEGQREYSDLVKSIATRVGISTTVLDNKDLSPTSTATFNDIAVLDEYLDRVSDDNTVKRVTHITDELQAIKKKYNTRYICWTGVLAAQVKDEEAANTCINSVGCPILIPIALFQAITPDYVTYFYTIVLDLETGKTTYSKSEVYSIHDDGDVVKGTLYHTFSNIKNKSKSKNKKK